MSNETQTTNDGGSDEHLEQDSYFEDLNEDFDLDSEGDNADDSNSSESTEDSDKVPTPAPVEGEKESPTPVPAAEVVPPSVAAPPAPEAPAAPPIAPPPAPAPAPFDEAAYLAEHLPRLEKLYVFSEEEATQLQTEPELVLPKLAARLHARIVQDALSGIGAVIPQIIEQQQARRAAEDDSWNTFYSVNGDIKDRVSREQILSVAGMFKQINPTADAPTIVREVGRIIRTSLGLPDPAAAAPAVAQQTPSMPTNPRPFTPALGAGQATQVKSTNAWASMADELDDY